MLVAGQHGRVDAGRHALLGLDDLVREARVNCGLRVVPRLGVHGGTHVLNVHAGACGDDARNGSVNGLKALCGHKKLCRVAARVGPCVMNHQLREVAHDDLVRHDGDVGGRRGRDAVNVCGGLALVALDGRGDAEALVHVAAAAVDADVERLGTQLVKRRCEVLGRVARIPVPEVAPDGAVEVHRRALGLILDLKHSFLLLPSGSRLRVPSASLRWTS